MEHQTRHSSLEFRGHLWLSATFFIKAGYPTKDWTHYTSAHFSRTWGHKQVLVREASETELHQTQLKRKTLQ